MKSQKVTNTDQDQSCLPLRDLLFENWFFKDSPYWTFWVHGVDGLEVRFCEIRFVNLLDSILARHGRRLRL